MRNIISSKNKIDLQSLFFIIMVSFYLLSTIMPFVTRVIDAYFFMATVLILFLGMLLNNNKEFKNILVFLFPFSGIFLVELIYNYLYYSSLIIFLYNQLLQLFFPSVLCFYLLTKNQKKRINWFVFLIIFAFSVTAITSIVGLMNDTSAARILATISDSQNDYFISLNLKNIGGYTTVYSLVLIFPMLICLFKRNKLKKYQFFIILVTYCLYLIYAQYTIALILFFSSGVFIILPRRINKKRLIFIIMALGVIMLFIKPLLGDLFYYLSNNSNSNEVSTRLYVVGDLLNGLNNTSEANTRTPLILNDINIFLKHPIFGSMFSEGGINSGHSFILDILAKSGIIGGLALIIMYRQIYRKFYLPFKDTFYYGYMVWSFGQAIILSLINTGSWLFIIAFIVPLIAYILQNKRYKLLNKKGVLIEDIMD